MTHREAHDALADVVWWLKGYNDGLQGNATAAHLLEQVQAVQNFINSTRPIVDQTPQPPHTVGAEAIAKARGLS